MTEVDEHQRQLGEALEDGNMERVEQLMTAISAAERRRNRAVQAAAGSPGPRSVADRPLRESLITALDFVGRPAGLSLLNAVARARLGRQLPTERVSSLRRDEANSFASAPWARPVYVVPVLSWDRFAPVRGTLGLSSWALEDRIIAPASPRVDLLLSIRHLTEHIEADPDAVWASGISHLVWSLSRSVPDAVGELPDGSFALVEVKTAAQAELARLYDTDRAERLAAAERAGLQLDEYAQLFGARGLRIVTDNDQSASPTQRAAGARRGTP
jgi:hypothetical protein